MRAASTARAALRCGKRPAQVCDARRAATERAAARRHSAFAALDPCCSLQHMPLTWSSLHCCCCFRTLQVRSSCDTMDVRPITHSRVSRAGGAAPADAAAAACCIHPSCAALHTHQPTSPQQWAGISHIWSSLEALLGAPNSVVRQVSRGTYSMRFAEPYLNQHRLFTLAGLS